MKMLTQQSWEITNDDNETINISFEKFTHGVVMYIQDGKSTIRLEEEQIKVK